MNFLSFCHLNIFSFYSCFRQIFLLDIELFDTYFLSIHQIIPHPVASGVAFEKSAASLSARREVCLFSLSAFKGFSLLRAL